jgi:hypothetical protein
MQENFIRPNGCKRDFHKMPEAPRQAEQRTDGPCAKTAPKIGCFCASCLFLRQNTQMTSLKFRQLHTLKFQGFFDIIGVL